MCDFQVITSKAISNLRILGAPEVGMLDSHGGYDEHCACDCRIKRSLPTSLGRKYAYAIQVQVPLLLLFSVHLRRCPSIGPLKEGCLY
jgi:hypothetical protein